MNITVKDDLIEKGLLLTLILAEFEKLSLGKELVFKGGTLLSRNYLNFALSLVSCTLFYTQNAKV